MYGWHYGQPEADRGAMRVLLVTPELPSQHAFSGGATRLFQLFRCFLAAGHEVTIIAPARGDQQNDVDALRSEGFTVHATRRPASRVRELLEAILRRPQLLLEALTLPLQAFFCRVLWVPMRPIALHQLRKHEFDIVYLVHDYATPWLDDLPERPATVVELQNVTSEYASTTADELSGLARHFYRFDQKRYLKVAKRHLPNVDAQVFVSEEESALLQSLIPENRAKRIVVANGADFESLAAVAPDPREAVMLFTGTMSYPPNYRGAIWFIEEILPLVREHVANASLIVAGRDPVEALVDHGAADGVTVTGGVDSMIPYFSQASIGVVPLRSGAGTRLKIAEAFAARRAVVSTSLGASGLPVTSGNELVLANEATAFADAVVELLNHQDRRDQIAEAGHQFGSTHIDWRQLGDELVAALEEVIADNGSVPR
jgi:glycosyltransferase involved in cell wall biosynthesis